MDTKNILRDNSENEISKEKLAENLRGFIDAKTGWITIPITEKMIKESSQLESVSSEF